MKMSNLFQWITEADVSGLGMDMVSPWTSRVTSERDVPVIRLEEDGDLHKIYEFGNKLGQGNFGVVYDATHIKTQTNWAIKVVNRPVAGSSNVKMLEHEINILKQVNHPHIIHLKEVYRTPEVVYLVTEMCAGGELRQLLKQKKFFTEDETRHIICSLADAVVYLHKRDIVHRDLKLENILVKNSPHEDDNDRINIKVSDFGLSVKTGGVGIENIMTEACGTLMYMAPEMMSGHGYSLGCDVWSLGVIMYTLLCGEPPFVSKTKAKLLEKMNTKVTFTQPIWATVSDAAKNLLICLLKADPAYRMSANQLLENPWITGDTNMPAIPSNVMDMMHNYLEEKRRKETLEVLSLTSSEDSQDLSPVPRAGSTEIDSNCRSPAKLSPERDSSFCTPSTSTRPTKGSGGSLQQDKHKNGSGSSGRPQPTTTQSQAGVKPTIQTIAKQHTPHDKKDLSAGQKQASHLRKALNQTRPSTSFKTRTGPRKPPAGSKTNTHLE